MADLSDREQDLLAALVGGETLNDYARRNNYSLAWGQWASRKLRDHFGVKTIREAVAMSSTEGEGVSRADFEKLTGLVSKLGESLDELAKRPNDSGRQEQVRERELDVKDHAKALGLSLEDVEKLKGEKEYEKFVKMQDRLDAERSAADDEEDDENGDGGDGRSAVTKVLDGLGGIRNVKPS